MTAEWHPAHRTCAGGARSWVAADPRAAEAPALDPYLPVMVVADAGQGWLRVRCENGWETWVAAASLVPDGAMPHPPAPAAIAPASSRASGITMIVLVALIAIAVWGLQLARSSMEPSTAKVVGVVGIAISIGLFAWALRGFRRPSRTRGVFDIGRGAITSAAALGIGYVTHHAAPTAIAIASAFAGLLVGFVEGMSTEVVLGGDGRRYARRAVAPTVLSFVGLMVGVAGALGGSAVAVQWGQTGAMMGAGLAFGVPLARTWRPAPAAALGALGATIGGGSIVGSRGVAGSPNLDGIYDASSPRSSRPSSP